MLPFEIEQRLEEIKSQIEALGAELIDISLRKSGTRSVLTIIADKPGGITLEECARINRTLGDYFEQNEGLIQGSYVLEVNSPGLDRPLKTARDFERARGQTVRVITPDQRGIARAMIAEVLSVQGETVEFRVLDSGVVMLLPVERVIKASCQISFNKR